MEQDTLMNTNETLDYIAGCELADDCAAQVKGYAAAGMMAFLGADVTDAPAQKERDNGKEGAVVASSLVAFAEGVSRQNKNDVMESFLFATLVANKAFSPETQGDQWYDKFNEVLAKIGWLSTHWNYARYRGAQQRFTMDEVGLEILGSAVAAAALPGPASLAMLKVAGDAIAALRAKEEPLRLFESQTKAHRGGNFRIASCVESQDGTVNLAMGAVKFQADSAVTNVLFWEWQNTHVETWLGESHLVFNTAFYARHRELIQDKLGSNAKRAIEEFDI
ncbi:hypothetical protein G7013_12285 [Pseudomonas viridiflava]|uniref:hypothetical protein n=1 Tax=Pseudomonas viridiflava TaxID=33069 RepID=UPI0015E457D2|nr:hypothetical protein [Pseudomonas viridiflava]MBA1230422.1 hypothetical protein [Pseudomonas viridiflava]